MTVIDASNNNEDIVQGGTGILDSISRAGLTKIMVISLSACFCVSQIFGSNAQNLEIVQQVNRNHARAMATTVAVQPRVIAADVITAPVPRKEFPDESGAVQWFSDVAGEGVVECAKVREMVRSGEWADPNRDQVLVRRIDTEPHFFVSVHNKEYDVVRYKSIYKKGNYYELQVRARFEHILAENMNAFDYSNDKMPMVLDIGGNIGYYTLLSAAWRHAVMTFEINPANLIRICESLHLNEPTVQGVSDLSHQMAVKIFQRGASDSTGTTFEIKVPRNPGQVGINNKGTKQLRSGHEATDRMFTVTTVTLDDLAAEKEWFGRDDISFSILKIDTEGHEKQIVEGAPKFLKAHFAKNILIEYRPHCFEAIKMILDSGYVLVDDSSAQKRMLSKAESLAVFEKANIDLPRTKIWKFWNRNRNFEDFWFRLENLPL